MGFPALNTADSLSAWRWGRTTAALVYAGSFSVFLATLLNAVAFSTRAWVVGPGTEHSPFVGIGFHEACFYECRHPYCPGGDKTFVYDGCHWVFSEHFRELWEWLRPEWYMYARYLAIVATPMTLVCMILTCFCLCLTTVAQCSSKYSPRREIFTTVLLYLTAALIFCTVVIILVVLGVMQFHGFQLGWMPMPDRNSLGYSFWLDAAAVLFFFASFIMLLVAAIFKTLWKTSVSTEPDVGVSMMMGRA